MESNNSERYNYSKIKRYIYELLNFMEKINGEQYNLLPEKLDFLIQASKDLGLSFIYLLLGIKSKTSEKSLGVFFISLYFDEIEKQRIEKLFNIISEAFNYIGPKNYLISNPVEDEFLNNIENFGILNNLESKPRPQGTQIENIYFKIASAIDCYNTYIGINEYTEEGIKEIKLKYDECKKELDILKNNKEIKYLKFHIDFFTDLLNFIDFNKLYKKNDDMDINSNNNILDLSLSRSSSSFSQHLEKISLKNRKFFIINEIVNFGEDTEIEFKNYHFFNEHKEIIPKNLIEKIQKLICGLLNSKGGRIYFGINDEKVVKGNTLTYKQRDDLRLELINLTSNFYPDCKSSKLSVHFIPIKDANQKFLNNKYVTKMIVKQGDTDKLYSVSNKVYESYKRIQGMVSQLRPEVIAEEIFKRKSKPEEPIPDYEFNDPEPENNYENYNFDNYNNNFIGNIRRNKKKRNKKHYDNLVSIKIKNISEETPIFILEEIFSQYNDVIINMKFFENNGLSLGHGFIDVKDMNSAQKLMQSLDGMNLYGKKIKLLIKK